MYSVILFIYILYISLLHIAYTEGITKRELGKGLGNSFCSPVVKSYIFPRIMKLLFWKKNGLLIFNGKIGLKFCLIRLIQALFNLECIKEESKDWWYIDLIVTLLDPLPEEIWYEHIAQ